jgi:hypothetical protein
LLRGEAVERAIGGVDRNDGAIRIGERQRLRGRFPDRPEALLTLAQRGLDRTPLGRDGWLAGIDSIDGGEGFVGDGLSLLVEIVTSAPPAPPVSTVVERIGW